MDIDELKERSKNLDPVLRIGKFGITPNVTLEIDKLLKKRKLIKIKILNNCPIENKDDMIASIIEKSCSVLVSRVGNVFTIYREKDKK